MLGLSCRYHMDFFATPRDLTASAMALFVLAATATKARIIAAKFWCFAPVSFRHSLVLMVAIRTVHVRFRCNSFGIGLGGGHELTPDGRE